jgi:hypothetical protein
MNEIDCIFSTHEKKYIFKKYVKLTARCRYCIRIYISVKMVHIIFGVFENRPPKIQCYFKHRCIMKYFLANSVVASQRRRLC